ncbi:MAG: M1 family metallopeptidase [Bacteroidota bacterium]
MKHIFLILISYFLFLIPSQGQTQRWQQSVKYTMNIDVDTLANQFKGKQKLIYQNNSNDKLDRVFYHLYWNAFQPNSSMDVRSRELGKKLVNGRQDWDGRVKDRILNLKETEIGYQKIVSLKMNGVPQKFKYHETILEVNLTTPILPKTSVVFDMEFEAQIPLQVRRSGRDNPQTGVRYSMSQWYPKLCEYDYEGWHPTPYVAREFYGVWGDFDVTINIDKSYKLGGTGVLVNASEIGWGYDKPETELKPCLTSKRSWHFKGENIHDFVWAADPDYKHLTRKVANGPMLHVIYNNVPNDKYNDSLWIKVADASVKVLPFIEKNFGKYPYPQYSFIHGGDGGMEYPMATLLSGPSLGTVFHEWMHSWYQMMLGTNESLYAWMDEGFTSFAEDLVTKFYNNRSSLMEYKDAAEKDPKNEELKNLIASLPEDHSGSYASYFALVKSKLEEPLCTHADHYNTNFSYSINSYSKGEIFLEQLGYIIGSAARDKVLLQYYKEWRFKHPNAEDFIRIAENTSGIKLDWYKEYWVHSTKSIDYSIDSLWEENGMSKIRLKRIGNMPMPVDLQLTFKDGISEMHSIPLNLMYGSKLPENKNIPTTTEEEWRWTHPTYVVSFKRRLTDLKKAEVDPSKRMADVDRKNNGIELNW